MFLGEVSKKTIKEILRGFPGESVVKNPPTNAGDLGSIPDQRRSHMPWNS